MGYDANGFTPKTLLEISDDIKASVRADTDPTLVLDDIDPMGRVIMAASHEIAQGWEVTQASFDGLDPNNAEGAILSGTVQLTGTKRLSASKTRVPCNCTLVAGTVLLPGTAKAHVSGKPTLVFTPSVSDYPLGFTAPSTGVHSVIFEATQTGPIEAFAGTLNQITIPVAGWSVVTNPADASKGTLEENDTDLATRQATEQAAVGSGYIDAIRADVLAFVQSFYPQGSVTALENNAMTVVDGMLPKSVEVIIWDGPVPFVAQDQAIANVFFKTKGSGIASNGDIVKVFTDLQNYTHEVRFRRATLRQVYFNLAATYDPAILTTPAQVTATVAAIKAALVAKGETRRVAGLDVTRGAYFPVLSQTPGIVEVTLYAHALDAPAGSSESVTALVIPRRELAFIQTANIALVLTPNGEL